VADRAYRADVGAGPETVGDRYRLIEIIAKGGMGRVWRAHDEVLDREVAVKELLPPPDLPAADARAVQARTLREARAAARLDHPGVVTVYDVLNTGERSWIVMEYVPSRTLHQVVSQDGPLNHREAARVGLAVLDALRAAHAAGVLHRDVKPPNVLLADDGRVVLTDFGLASIDVGGAEHSGPLLGSPHFIAPERVRTGVSSVATDLWSLGATLYAAVEGRPPFDRKSVSAALTALLTDEPDPPRRPGPLHPVIAGLLTTDPARRSSAADATAGMRRVVQRAVGVVAVPKPRPPADDAVRYRSAAVPVLPPAGRTGKPPADPTNRPPAGPAAETPAGPTEKPAVAGAAVRRGHGGRWAVASALVLGAAVTGGAVAWANGSDRPPAPTPAAVVATPIVSACDNAPAQPVRAAPGEAPISLRDGWLWYADPAGFALPVPGNWTRAGNGATVCFADPEGIRSFAVDTVVPRTGYPLKYWQAAEKSSPPPGYARNSMGVLLVTAGGADWDYSWQPVNGPRLRTHRVLLSATGPRPFALTWTTRDQDWALDMVTQRTLLNGFRDSAAPATTWAVPAPGK
jgi:tRNA A-37 threonylcarbamoyl transferase component Bud32